MRVSFPNTEVQRARRYTETFALKFLSLCNSVPSVSLCLRIRDFPSAGAPGVFRGAEKEAPKISARAWRFGRRGC